MNGGHGRRAVASPMAAMNPPRPMSLSVCCAAGGQSAHGRPARTQPAADQSRTSAPPPPPSVTAKEPTLTLSNPTSRPAAIPAGEEGDIGPVAVAHGRPTLRRRATSRGWADQCHDVADIDRSFPGVSGTSCPCWSGRAGIRRARCRRPDRLFPASPTVKVAVVDENVEHVARESLRISSPSISGPIEAPAATMAAVGPARTMSSPAFEDVSPRLDIGAAADDPFDDGTAADLDLRWRRPSARRRPRPDRPAPGTSGNPGFPVLRALPPESVASSLAASSLRLMPISQGAANGTNSSVRM